MSLTIELSPLQERLIRETAAREGVSVGEIVGRILEERFPTSNGAVPSEKERVDEEKLFAQLHANMNETRRSLGMREL